MRNAQETENDGGIIKTGKIGKKRAGQDDMQKDMEISFFLKKARKQLYIYATLGSMKYSEKGIKIGKHVRGLQGKGIEELAEDTRKDHYMTENVRKIYERKT